MTRIARFRRTEKVNWGIIENDRIFAIEGDIYSEFRKGKELCKVQEVRLLAPAEPRIMVACAFNYVDHLKEMNQYVEHMKPTDQVSPDEPKVFFKPPNTLIGPLDEVVFPAMSKDYRFEAELCVVMKRQTRNVAEEDALNYVLGYTCGNDLGALDLFKKDGWLTRARGFDTSGALGPYLVTDLNPSNLNIKGRVNRELRQDSSTRFMIHSVPKLISFISGFMTLLPGDVIWTGTPKGGASPVKVGDITEVEIEGIGILKNSVAGPNR